MEQRERKAHTAPGCVAAEQGHLLKGNLPWGTSSYLGQGREDLWFAQPIPILLEENTSSLWVSGNTLADIGS